MNIPLYIKRKKTVKYFYKPYVSFYVWFDVSLDFICNRSDKGILVSSSRRANKGIIVT